jgi:hypothetical protein
MAVLYGRDGRLTAQNGGFLPGQEVRTLEGGQVRLRFAGGWVSLASKKTGTPSPRRRRHSRPPLYMF